MCLDRIDMSKDLKLIKTLIQQGSILAAVEIIDDDLHKLDGTYSD